MSVYDFTVKSATDTDIALSRIWAGVAGRM
jgi:hypothetical protein